MSELYVVLGGGPVGCYLAYSLLAKTDGRVAMFEGRLFDRPQVVRIPFAIANDLPQAIKQEMWSDAATRQRIFSAHSLNALDFWPRPGYLYWPWLSIGSFQTAMVAYLQREYINRFFFIPQSVEHSGLEDAIQAVYPHISLPKISAIFCSCGNYAKTFRNESSLEAGKPVEMKGHGIYLIYQNTQIESYYRQSKPLSYMELAEQGISYAAANNLKRDVQLYVYPAGKLTDLFAHMPSSFMQHGSYRSLEQALDFTGKGLPEDAMSWFTRFANELTEQLQSAEIQLPADKSSVKVYYAVRGEYYWQTVAYEQKDSPLFFVGDSAGSTDYKMGLSVGRGLLAAQYLADSIAEHVSDPRLTITSYQHYWNEVIAREFNKGPGLTAEPWIQYLYLIKGRKVIDARNKETLFAGHADYHQYLAACRHMPNFGASSEASAVVYINTRAIQHNIDALQALAKNSADSKLVAVVKGDGYGLGAKLMARLAVEAGIDFLAVAKLDEAVALREAGFAPPIRIMVFESPLLHDLNCYAQYDIEALLPSAVNGKSADLLVKWLHMNPRHSLKVHVMVDTGLRRDGGHASSLPQAVLHTLEAIKQLPQQAISLVGLATHLACYRCTDYNGVEVVDYRDLQLTRLHQVLDYVIAHGIVIPMVHVGGGLALLAEQWPHRFKRLSQQYGLQLYTRVGHGIYGMELATDLNTTSPSLRSTVEMSLQVRNIFYVEGGEPVSYGGHWRAPPEGAWIATLSGGWYEGVPRTAKTLGLSEKSMMVGIKGKQYPVIGAINMNAMMVYLGLETQVQPGDKAVLFSWQPHQPQLYQLAALSGHISPSITVNIPLSIARVPVSE